jgi:hypothetical protein
MIDADLPSHAGAFGQLQSGHQAARAWLLGRRAEPPRVETRVG